MKTIDLQPVTRPDVTIIPNSIIDKDMLEANELQLKVYLYILRNISSGIPVQISSMADHFNETEKDITRAVSFWEKRGVFSACQDTRQGQEYPAAAMSYNADPAAEGAPCRQTPVSPDVPHNTVTEESYSSDSLISYSELTRDNLRTLKNSQDFKELSFVAETYMGKPLSRSDCNTLLFIKDSLNFSNELIEFLLEYCAERGKKSFKYVQTVACAWSKQGITTPEEAQARGIMYSQRIYAVMNALGKKSEPTNAELNYIERWYQQYGFEADMILEACRRTVLATDKNRFSYAEKILSSWYAAGVHHTNDISRADAAFQTQKKQTEGTARKTPAYAAGNPFLQHKQNDTDYDALEKQLLQN